MSIFYRKKKKRGNQRGQLLLLYIKKNMRFYHLKFTKHTLIFYYSFSTVYFIFAKKKYTCFFFKKNSFSHGAKI